MERESKEDLRKEIACLRERVSPEEKADWDQKLCREFFRQLDQNYSIFWKKMIYLYLDIRREAGTRLILQELWRRGIGTAVPKVCGRELEFYQIRGEGDSSVEALKPGYMGILEPVKVVCSQVRQEEALVVVPGLAFDRKGYRLGYGGGFYDRFFAREPKHPKWALAYGFQIRNSLPKENWDQRMDKIITPAETIESKGKYGIGGSI